MITMTENYVHNALILIVVLYGFMKTRWNLEPVTLDECAAKMK